MINSKKYLFSGFIALLCAGTNVHAFDFKVWACALPIVANLAHTSIQLSADSHTQNMINPIKRSQKAYEDIRIFEKIINFLPVNPGTALSWKNTVFDFMKNTGTAMPFALVGQIALIALIKSQISTNFYPGVTAIEASAIFASLTLFTPIFRYIRKKINFKSRTQDYIASAKTRDLPRYEDIYLQPEYPDSAYQSVKNTAFNLLDKATQGPPPSYEEYTGRIQN